MACISAAMDQRDESLEPGLYIVATPIGNLGDITMRAAATLRGAKAVACEDTRVTGRLMQHLGLKQRLIRYDDHADERARGGLLDLAADAAVALVSDAGTPLISDPGYRLVHEARERGINVVAVAHKFHVEPVVLTENTPYTTPGPLAEGEVENLLHLRLHLDLLFRGAVTVAEQGDDAFQLIGLPNACTKALHVPDEDEAAKQWMDQIANLGPDEEVGDGAMAFADVMATRMEFSCAPAS